MVGFMDDSSDAPEQRYNSRKGRPNKGPRRDMKERFTLDAESEDVLRVVLEEIE